MLQSCQELEAQGQCTTAERASRGQGLRGFTHTPRLCPEAHIASLLHPAQPLSPLTGLHPAQLPERVRGENRQVPPSPLPLPPRARLWLNLQGLHPTQAGTKYPQKKGNVPSGTASGCTSICSTLWLPSPPQTPSSICPFRSVHTETTSLLTSVSPGHSSPPSPEPCSHPGILLFPKSPPVCLWQMRSPVLDATNHALTHMSHKRACAPFPFSMAQLDHSCPTDWTYQMGLSPPCLSLP